MQAKKHTIRVYLNPDKEGAVTCPKCGLGRKVKLAQQDKYVGGKRVKIYCKRCDEAFQGSLDHRRYIRMPVQFPGKVCSVDTQRPEQSVVQYIMVTSLSVAGVGFRVSPKAQIVVNDMLDIHFRLDDAEHFVVQERIIVRRVLGRFIGAEYTQDIYRYELDFYILRPA